MAPSAKPDIGPSRIPIAEGAARRTQFETASDRVLFPDVTRQAFDQSVEDDAAAPRLLEVFVHRQPCVEAWLELGQKAHKARIAPGEADLADADAKAGADRRQVGELVVGTQREKIAVNFADLRLQRAHGRGVAVEANQSVLAEIGDGFRDAVALQIVLA